MQLRINCNDFFLNVNNTLCHVTEIVSRYLSQICTADFFVYDLHEFILLRFAYGVVIIAELGSIYNEFVIPTTLNNVYLTFLFRFHNKNVLLLQIILIATVMFHLA